MPIGLVRLVSLHIYCDPFSGSQLGGTFVVQAGGSVILAHKQEYAGDYVDNAEILVRFPSSISARCVGGILNSNSANRPPAALGVLSSLGKRRFRVACEGCSRAVTFLFGAYYVWLHLRPGFLNI